MQHAARANTDWVLPLMMEGHGTKCLLEPVASYLFFGFVLTCRYKRHSVCDDVISFILPISRPESGLSKFEDILAGTDNATFFLNLEKH